MDLVEPGSIHKLDIEYSFNFKTRLQLREILGYVPNNTVYVKFVEENDKTLIVRRRELDLAGSYGMPFQLPTQFYFSGPNALIRAYSDNEFKFTNFSPAFSV